MSIKKINLNSIILFILVFLTVYQDSPLSEYLGSGGYSILTPLSLILCPLYIIIHRRIIVNRYVKSLFYLGIWLTIVNFFSIIVWYIVDGRMTVLGEFLPVKSVKSLLQYFCFPAYVWLVVTYGRKSNIENFFRISLFTLFFLAIICLIEINYIPYAFKEIHFAGPIPYWRVRLLTMESSHTATLIYTHISLSFYYALHYKKTKYFIPIIICAAILILCTDSKTLLISLLVTIIIYFIITLKQINKKHIVYIIITIVLFILYYDLLLQNLVSTINSDIDNHTSIATRSYTSFIGLVIGTIFFTGIGSSVYLAVLPDFLLNNISIVKSYFPKLNYQEIYSLIYAKTDLALTVKSGFFHYYMCWGILGTGYLIYNFIKLSNEIKTSKYEHKNILIAFFWTEGVMLFSNNFSFEFWLMYALLILIQEEIKSKIK